MIEIEGALVTSEDDDANVYDAAPRHRTVSRGAGDYRAWHHPRKQWVRIYQWCENVRNLLKELNLGGESTFNYLTLPGNELLDVRALHGVCEREQTRLRYVGFNSVAPNSADQSELNISRHEVSSLPWIDQFSHVEEDRLETIVNPSSKGRSRLLDVGHFHAVNLDLCDALSLRDAAHPNGSILGALRAIIDQQIQQAKPWLLFVTTKVEAGLVSQVVREGFDSAIENNIENSDEFGDRFAQILGAEPNNLSEVRRKAWEESGERLVKMFATGLGKWLLRILSKTDPSRRLTLLSTCIYRSGHTPNMLSVAYRCDVARPQIEDRDGIFGSNEIRGRDQEEYDEVALGVRLANTMGDCFDLDAKLAEEHDLAERLIAQAGRLMATARYDESTYATWAREQINATRPVT